MESPRTLFLSRDKIYGHPKEFGKYKFGSAKSTQFGALKCNV